MGRILETIFAINGMIKPGFNAMVGGGEKGMKKLGASANQATALFGRLAKAMIGLAAAYVGWKGISTFFGDALKASEANEKINFKLLNTLRASQQIQKAGPGVAEDQYKKMVAISQELVKQGVLSAGNYRTAMAAGVEWGLAPEKAAQLSKAMGDVAVQQHGVNVTSEEFGSLMERATKAITTGRIQGLGPLVGHMTKAEKSAWKTMNETRKLQLVIELARRAAEGFNKAAADTPEGKVRTFRNEWGAFITQIGDRIKLFQGWLAGLQSRMLKAIGPEILSVLRRLQTEFASEGFQNALKALGKAYKEVFDALSPLADALGITEISGRAFGHWLAGEITQTIKDFAGYVSFVAKEIKGFGDEWNALMARLKEKGVLDAVSAELQTFQDDWRELSLRLDQLWSEWSERWVELVTEFGADWNKLVNNIQDLWAKVPQAFSDTNDLIKRALEGVYTTIVDAFQRAIDWVTAEWNKLKALITAPFNLANIFSGVPKAAPGGFSGGGSGAAQTAGTSGAFQLGGIVTRPTYSVLGEAGPEAVIPLERTARSLSLLARAAGALGVSTGGGGANVGPFNYGPTLNMGPGAEPGMLSRTRQMLRESADDFFNRYQAVWDEERRLAFE